MADLIAFLAVTVFVTAVGIGMAWDW